MNFQPGTAQQYNGMNTFLAGMIIERVTGHSYAHEVRSRSMGLQRVEQGGVVAWGKTGSRPGCASGVFATRDLGRKVVLGEPDRLRRRGDPLRRPSARHLVRARPVARADRGHRARQGRRAVSVRRGPVRPFRRPTGTPGGSPV
ncbi:hypothetical protein [Kitasatospora sp. HPMI-4]|uniref:hypothetical protein n=1 Tax=Kitasatospora sp. HPMI-4 TaxID=3448443 RepID=UPI003F1D915B